MKTVRQAVVALALLATPLAAQVRTVPSTPRQGSLVQVYAKGSAAAVPAMTLAGEPLHFERRGSEWWALAGIPVDADSVAFVRQEGADSTVTWLHVRPGGWPLEKLHVAPEFGRQPDSALTARIEDETRRAYAVGRRAHETPRLWRAPFVTPRPGRVTSTFGRGREYNGTVTSRHMGTDFAAAKGAPIRAPMRGVVAMVDTFYLGGRVVYLDHGAGLTTAYMHLTRPMVHVGDTVRAGQVIGLAGATGRVTGPHLHWTMRYGAITVDPLTLPGFHAAAASGKARKRRP